ncbi:MAG: hypothetical protein AVDCRST_MAG40-1586, partial [uncultured Gemmatimonadaceae bacterium]
MIQTICGTASAISRNRASLSRSASSARTRSMCAQARSTTVSSKAISPSVQSRGEDWWTAIIATSRSCLTSGQQTTALMPMALNMPPP